MRFAGIKNNRICLVSSCFLNSSDMEIIQIPKEYDGLSEIDIINNCRVSNNKIILKKQSKPAHQLKIALVGNFKMACGISTYSESLWPEVVKHVGSFKLFIEQNDSPTGDIHQLGNNKLTKEQVSVCWKRGESLQHLANEIKKYDPDIIWIQHEFGFFNCARHFLSFLTQIADYRTIITMHSVFPHHKDKLICESAMPEIVVHLEGAKENLKQEKKISSPVYVIPHGCDPCIDDNKLWNYYKSEHTLIQAGFGFRYKGIEQSITTVSLLKEKYPDVFLTVLFSESPHNKTEHNIYYNELIDLIDRLNVKENVAIIRGFFSDESMDSYLRTNKVAIFPYQSDPNHMVFGSSGAARLTMNKGLVVLSSKVHHFCDLPTIKADNPNQMAQQLDSLFSNPELMKSQLERQKTYLKENNWQNIAEKYIKLFENDIFDNKKN